MIRLEVVKSSQLFDSTPPPPNTDVTRPPRRLEVAIPHGNVHRQPFARILPCSRKASPFGFA